jgi:ubiquinone/menaquinone biosynthesis C-methylase UbiE
MGDAISHPKERLRERPSTYFLQDWSKQKERDRLEVQDKMLTLGMGEVLPESADPTLLRRVLDVGCGTGGWLIETAKRYPAIEKLVGVDISNTMVVHARQEATAAHLGGRVQFQMMDALRTLDLPTSSFDLVNQRLGFSWLRIWEWREVLWEYRRVCRPGGIICITEPHIIAENNSPALTQLNTLLLEAFWRSGHLFNPSTEGVTGELVRLLTQHGIQDVQSRVHTLVYRAGTQAGQNFYEDMTRAFQLFLPFFQKWTRVPDDYQKIYQQAKKEVQAPNFVATMTLLTAWGRSPEWLTRGL